MIQSNGCRVTTCDTWNFFTIFFVSDFCERYVLTSQNRGCRKIKRACFEYESLLIWLCLRKISLDILMMGLLFGMLRIAVGRRGLCVCGVVSRRGTGGSRPVTAHVCFDILLEIG